MSWIVRDPIVQSDLWSILVVVKTPRVVERSGKNSLIIPGGTIEQGNVRVVWLSFKVCIIKIIGEFLKFVLSERSLLSHCGLVPWRGWEGLFDLGYCPKYSYPRVVDGVCDLEERDSRLVGYVSSSDVAVFFSDSIGSYDCV